MLGRRGHGLNEEEVVVQAVYDVMDVLADCFSLRDCLPFFACAAVHPRPTEKEDYATRDTVSLALW